MINVLFLCIHNSARSQMAEAYLKKLGGDRFCVESAGLEAGKLNPLAVEVMKEEGFDISTNQTKNVLDYVKQGHLYHYVITVCDKEASDRCPIFPGLQKKINWNFTDPSLLTGTHEEKIAATRMIRDQIKEAVEGFIKELN
jgi:arsenate reductase (thioredoxin)